MQSGILYAASERDFQTGFSYFYEAFEGFDMASKRIEATLALKYMLLCKIMSNAPDDVHQIVITGKAMKYRGSDVDAMLAIGSAAKNRSVNEFNQVCNF
jgi:26S proteasome regulatory subunit N6